MKILGISPYLEAFLDGARSSKKYPGGGKTGVKFKLDGRDMIMILPPRKMQCLAVAVPLCS